MKKVYSFLVMSLISVSAFGQNCWVDYTSSNTGLPPGASNAIERVGTDIWITTDYGVIKWDGNRLNVLKPTQIAIGAAKTGPIKSLNEGLFIGSMKGLAEREYASGNWHQYNVAYSGIISDSVTAVNEDTTGHIFIGTLNGLSVVEGINWFNYTTSNSGLPSNRIRCIYSNDSSIWMGTDNGLVKWNFGSPTWTVYNAANTGNGLGSNIINDVFQDTSGTYWIATEQGITRFDGSAWTKYTQLSTSNGLGSDQINAISQDGNGRLLVATDYGFSTVPLNNLSSWTLYYSFNSGLNQSIFNDVYYDDLRMTVILASTQGVHMWDGSGSTGFVNFDYTNTGLTTNNIKLLHSDASGVWSGFTGGVFEFSGGAQNLLNTANSGMPSQTVNDISKDDFGRLVVGTTSGLLVWDNTSWQQFNVASGLPSNAVYIVEGGVNGTVYAGYATISNGLVVIDTAGTITQYKTNNSSIVSNQVMDIAQLANGSVAVATPSGLSIFSAGSFTNFTTSSGGLPANNIKALDEDDQGNLWLGISGTGLVKYSAGAFTTITGLPNASSIKKLRCNGTNVVVTNGNTVSVYSTITSTFTHYDATSAPFGSATVNDAAHQGASLWVATNLGMKVLLDSESLRTTPYILGRSSACTEDTVFVKAPLGFDSYAWNTGDTTVMVDTDSTQSFWFFATDVNGCVHKSDTVNIIVNPLPQVNFSLTNGLEFCLGDSLVIDPGPGYLNYFWNNGSTVQTQTIKDQDSTLWLTVRDVNGCYANSDTLDVTVWKPFDLEEICLVTVDSLNRNQIIWNKTLGKRTLEYGVYKQNPTTGTYVWIGSVPATGQLSVFSDPNSNARETSSRYKLSVVDSCGNESELSDNHKTMHLTLNEGISGEVNLIWDGYEGIDFLQYEIYRGPSPKTMLKLADVSSANFTYSDLNPPPGLLFYKVLVVNPDPCTPTGKTNAFGESTSNIAEYAATDNLIIYPNPFSDYARVVFKNPDLQSFDYKIFDATGTIVRYVTGINETFIDLYPESLPPGMYTIEVFNEEKSLRENFVIY